MMPFFLHLLETPLGPLQVLEPHFEWPRDSSVTTETHHQYVKTCTVYGVRDKGGDVLRDLGSVCCCQVGWRLDVNQEHEQDFFWISFSFIRHIYPSRNT